MFLKIMSIRIKGIFTVKERREKRRDFLNIAQNPKEPAGQDEHPLVASAAGPKISPAGKSVAPGPRATASRTARYLALAWQQQPRHQRGPGSGGTARCVGHSAGPWFTQPA